jgi:hypothetical protein
MSEAKVTVWTINADGTETPEKIRVMENSPVHHPECMDCGVDTDAINESYMVIDDLWRAAVPTEAGMLCVGCLEKRLGRTLQRKDFAKFCISAVDEGMPVSERLKARFNAVIHDAGKISMAGKSDMAVATDRFVLKPTKDNSDIGIRPGPESSEALVCTEAERLLKAGYVGTKEALAKRLSKWLARRHSDESSMSTDVIDRNPKFTALWRKYRPQQSRSPKK